ncbi:hypothetical protein JYT85_01105 [Desulfocapsa sp. AH-315-G09]|uniref:Quinohemoprotein amine dehydrogenase alpha subunit haem binding domain-containing protein n=1 Tax=Desulfotalea psychrophila TaxID=84980 RepID=A0ABS3ASE7_9BACT|nr:hypothetical protein [Desulfocapsa sp.]MBN4065230.1 hypothetical protein [Desulfocapsa sp. AH-315-G09]MBN4068045.1 hypothetical protein [Desulfotalea psychrophila]
MNYTRSIVLTTLALLVLQGCSTGDKCRQIVETKCTSCHSIKKSCDQVGKSKQYWGTTVDQMIRLNARISDGEKKKLVKCLGNSSTLMELCEK